MQIAQIVTEPTIYASNKDSIAYLLDLMEDYKLAGLPIVDQAHYMGYVLEADLINFSDSSLALPPAAIRHDPIFVYNNQHIYDALQISQHFALDFIPVITADQDYKGLLRPIDILKGLTALSSGDELGAILSLTLLKRDYSLSHLSHLIENENCKILSLAVQELPEEELLRLTLRLDTHQIEAVESALLRHNYTIEAQYHQAEPSSDLGSRFENLMKYLQM
ncbi:CBS domain-containing protein [Sphingobacteriaceae bacterium WQ 2009]|uniref:CBS domain-containing protein n=1 Tax=Rhinopithecimicrobium faecis TaxID=2820698 RepID=A0A8T4HF03_9SPHI|nr:CBS domain-containing protein [Sphingobacteriaceae bacterium WQ 2009]